MARKRTECGPTHFAGCACHEERAAKDRARLSAAIELLKKARPYVAELASQSAEESQHHKHQGPDAGCDGLCAAAVSDSELLFRIDAFLNDRANHPGEKEGG